MLHYKTIDIRYPSLITKVNFMRRIHIPLIGSSHEKYNVIIPFGNLEFLIYGRRFSVHCDRTFIPL